jgi:hypothetical protein
MILWLVRAVAKRLHNGGGPLVRLVQIRLG